MSKNKKGVYLPDERGQFDEKPKIIKAYSKKNFTLLPDPIVNPIVSNNISNVEFDYTYKEKDDF